MFQKIHRQLSSVTAREQKIYEDTEDSLQEYLQQTYKISTITANKLAASIASRYSYQLEDKFQKIKNDPICLIHSIIFFITTDLKRESLLKKISFFETTQEIREDLFAIVNQMSNPTDADSLNKLRQEVSDLLEETPPSQIAPGK